MPSQRSGSPLTLNSLPTAARSTTGAYLCRRAVIALSCGAIACLPVVCIPTTSTAQHNASAKQTTSAKLPGFAKSADLTGSLKNQAQPTEAGNAGSREPKRQDAMPAPLVIGSRDAANEASSTWPLLCSIAILAAAAFVQATVGFAAALFGLPLLLWAGNDLMQAQVLIITAMLPQNIFAVWKLREHLNWREIMWPAIIRISALPVGIAGLSSVMTWSSAAVNQLVGVIILGAIALQSLVGVEWKGARRPHWLFITFGGSGILQGLSGMSGPPMVLWVHGQRFSANHARAFLFAMYISNFPPQVALLYSRFGNDVLQAVQTATLAIPLVLVAAALGLRLGTRLGDKWLRPVTYACLIALAISSIVEPWLVDTVFPFFTSGGQQP